MLQKNEKPWADERIKLMEEEEEEEEGRDQNNSTIFNLFREPLLELNSFNYCFFFKHRFHTYNKCLYTSLVKYKIKNTAIKFNL